MEMENEWNKQGSFFILIGTNSSHIFESFT